MPHPSVLVRRVAWLCAVVLGWLGGGPVAEAVEAEVRPHQGRPTVFVDGKPITLAAYSPAGFSNRKLFEQEVDHFLGQPLNAFFVCIGAAKQPADEPEEIGRAHV